MKKFILLVLLSVFSCATFNSGPEETYPVHLRLLSSNELIKNTAVNEFNKMSNEGKLGVLLKMVELLESEEVPEKRIKILDTLQELKADYNVIIPLILSVSKNPSIIEYREIVYFLMNVRPDKNTIKELVKLLKDKRWNVNYLALVSLASNPKESVTALPEMVETMKKYSGDKEKYSKIFDLISMVNPEISILSLIKEFNSENSKVREAIFEKLIELQVFLSPEIEAKKEILPALIRGLYDEDSNISKMAQDVLKETDDPVAREAMESYLNMGKTLIGSFMKLTGKSMQDFFKSQDARIEKRIKEIYYDIGRKDAVK
ncbi:MAG: hypothetical protein KA120_03640 [Candidatus Goldbacteria bacterium]|nr:hypothetical protein [Candidatus Goldiibacteriota bacterium]